MRLVIFITGLTSLVLLFLFSAYLVQQSKQTVVQNVIPQTVTPTAASDREALVETVASSYSNPFNDLLAQNATPSANVVYPIVQLGNCANAQECYTFCLIPKNTPACWSYGTFILNTQVLGTSTSINDNQEKYISCDADESCKSYCQMNPDRCLGYSSTEQNYLGPSGCRNEEECQSFCQDHPSLCPGFSSGSQQPTNQQTTENVACTQDVKLCPDGSNVGRQPPNCEFAECPAP